MSDKQIKVGTNRTGIALARERTEAMIGDTEDLLSAQPSDLSAGDRARIESCVNAEPLGSIAPPTNFKGLAKTAILASAGGQPMLFMDKLGERLAFEKSGTRLYEALLLKHDALGSFPGGPERVELEELLEEEAEHYRMLQAAIESLAGDPTALTPSADLAGVAARGIFAVLTDPRTSLLQCLEAMLVAELTDNDGWDTLVELSELHGERAMRETFMQARADEADHLQRLRAWIATGQGRTVRRAVRELPPMPATPVSRTARIAASRARSTRKKTAKKKAARPTRPVAKKKKRLGPAHE